jgi:hypothetical protein
MSNSGRSRIQEWLIPDSLFDFPEAMLSQVNQVVIGLMRRSEAYRKGMDFSQPVDMMAVELVQRSSTSD